MLRALSECLRFSDKDLNTKVSQAFIALRTSGLSDYLVKQAFRHNKCSKHCERLLLIAEKVGEPLSAETWMQLPLLGFKRSLEIRAAITRMNWKLRPCPSKSPPIHMGSQ